MEQYIPKSALVAEIEKLKGKVSDSSSYCNGWQQALRMLELSLNTLEVKEINLDFEQELYKAFGQIKDFTLGIAIAKRFYDMGRKHNEPVSEDLEEEIKRWEESFKNCPASMGYKETARHFAKWKIAKLMTNATEVTVHIDSGGYPYIPQMELYDYDNDVPLAKEGDKYKVILIKEG